VYEKKFLLQVRSEVDGGGSLPSAGGGTAFDSRRVDRQVGAGLIRKGDAENL
jgi:hypothetical protein